MATPISSRTGLESFPSRSAGRLAWPAAAFAASPASLLDRHAGETQILAMDVAGSGRADLVQIASAADGQLHATTYLAAPAPGGIAYRRAADTALGSFGSQYQVLPGDLDGDGRADLLVAYASGPARELRLAAFLSNGSGFAAAGSFATGQAFGPKHLAFHAVDTSGDGRADLVEVYERTDPARGGLLSFRTWRSCFGDGQRTFGDGVVSRTADAIRPAGEVLGFWPLDTSGDGAKDLVRVRRRAADDHLIVETYRAVAAPGGTTFAPAVVSDLGEFPLANQPAFHALDADGDGIADLVQVWTEISASGTRLHLTTFFGDGEGGFVAGPDSVFADTAAHAFYVLGQGGGRSASLVGRWISSAGRSMLTPFRASPAGVFRQDRPCDAGPAAPGVASAIYLAADADGDGTDDLLRLRTGALGEVEVLPYLSAAASERPAAVFPSKLAIFRRDPSGSRPAGSAAGG